MATRIESSRNLVSAQSIAFIRPINLWVKLVGARPTTPINIFFDGVKVNELCTTTLITNSVGDLNTILSIPGGRFTTGSKSVVLTDADTIDQVNVAGSTFGSGTATFTSTGILQTFQTAVTEVTTVVVEEIRQIVPFSVRPVGDPLAQSFFTYGVKGGMFVSSIGLYFSSKDSTLPVRVDIREMINGYPASLGPTNTDYIISKPASEIAISSNASVETKFEFPFPVYLEEDKDYCFVVFSNSNRYNLFSSRIGELSIETGNRIFEQPYIGSMFKSENNITWSAEQFEDLKFKIYQASFVPNHVGTLTLNVTPNYWSIPGTSFITTSGSSSVRVNMKVKHGLTDTSKINIIGVTGAVYNGILSADFVGTRIVSTIVDEYTFEFNAASNASSSGNITTGGTVTSINVLTRGSNYTTATVSFTGGGGSGAAATAIISSGEVVRIDITNIGSGYISAPVIAITGDGSGATATAIIDAMFSVQTNMTVTSIAPNIPARTYDTTNISINANLTNMIFDGSSVAPYSNGGTVTISHDRRTALPSYSLIASRVNEIDKMASIPSMAVTYSFYTKNGNVSPIIDMRDSPSMIAYSNNLRNQTGEEVSATNSTGTVSSISLLNSGSGYIGVPTVTIIGSGTGATATAVLGTTAVSTINVTNGGTGFTSVPTVTITGDGTGATATATLSATSVASINVTNSGSGYTSTPSVVFVGGGGGSGAAASVTLSTIYVQSVAVTDGGSGYTSVPTVSFSGGGGSGASAIATVVGNVVTEITMTNGGSGYTSAPTVTITGGGGSGAAATSTLGPRTVSLITVTNGGSGYTVAPSITFSGGGGTGAAATATLSTRSVSSITLTNGGSGFTTAPTVTITGGGGSGATATAEIAGKNITDIIVTNPGQNYSSIPDVVIERVEASSGVDAIAIASLTTFNSEVSPISGTNTSRYISKINKLETPSSGINLFSEIYSENESSVDWYIRTSMSGSNTNHIELNWTPLLCDSTRNKSSKADEKFDYKFYKYDLPAFDTYDLKCVMRSSNPVKAPKVYNYRSIIVA